MAVKMFIFSICEYEFSQACKAENRCWKLLQVQFCIFHDDKLFGL